MHRIYMKLRENLTNVMENSDGKSIFHLLLEDKNYVTMKFVIKSLNSSSKGLHNTSHTGMYIIVCIYIYICMHIMSSLYQKTMVYSLRGTPPIVISSDV